MNSSSVPFTIPNINHGFQKANGLVRCWNQGLELEFKVAFLGIVNSDVRTIKITYSDLQQVDYEEGWFKDSIILKGNSMRIFEDIPGTEVAVCTLTVKKKNREDAKSLVSQAQIQLSELMLDDLDD